MENNVIIVKPIYTEKSLAMAAKGSYVFQVALGASKHQVKKAVHDLFNVDAQTVRTMRVKGSTKRAGKKRMTVNLSDYKKAIVILKKGQKLDLFEQEASGSKKNEEAK